MERVEGLIVGLTVLAIFIAAAIYVLSKIRKSRTQNDAPSAQDMLNQFGELYDSGELTKEEFRAVKRTLAVAITAEIDQKKRAQKDDGDPNETPEEREKRRRLERLLRN